MDMVNEQKGVCEENGGEGRTVRGQGPFDLAPPVPIIRWIWPEARKWRQSQTQFLLWYQT
jgi:hypothetical protein